MTLRSWHRDCAGNELLLSLGSSSSPTLVLGLTPWSGFLAAGLGWGLILCEPDMVMHQLA